MRISSLCENLIVLYGAKLAPVAMVYINDINDVLRGNKGSIRIDRRPAFIKPREWNGM